MEIIGRINLGDIVRKDEGVVVEATINPEAEIEVTLSSFDDDGIHEEMAKLVGKKLRVTIDIIED